MGPFEHKHFDFITSSHSNMWLEFELKLRAFAKHSLPMLYYWVTLHHIYTDSIESLQFSTCSIANTVVYYVLKVACHLVYCECELLCHISTFKIHNNSTLARTHSTAIVCEMCVCCSYASRITNIWLETIPFSWKFFCNEGWEFQIIAIENTVTIAIVQYHRQ